MLKRRGMKQIRLSGREASLIRALRFGLAVPGTELLESTRLSDEDLADVLNAMMEVGYVESTPFTEKTSAGALATTAFEINSAYVHELKAAIGFHRR
jgi:hypothetical protein